jgi:2-iminobutanoate/2-iminopropanoate deaminase
MPNPTHHMVKGAATAVAPYSHYVNFGDLVFVTGQIGMTPGDDSIPIPKDIESETRRVMENLRIIMADSGLTLDDVLASRVFLTRFEQDYERMNAVYKTYFKPGKFPMRTCIGVTALARGSNLEIDFICRRPAKKAKKAARRPARTSSRTRRRR